MTSSPKRTLTQQALQSPRASMGCAIVLLVPCIWLLVVAGPIGIGAVAVPLYMIAVSWYSLSRSLSKAQAVIKRAVRHPADAEGILTTGLQRLPGQPALVLALARHYRDQKRWQDAVVEYRRLLEAVPTDPYARGELAQTYMHLADWRSATAEFVQVRQTPGLVDDSRASISAALAVSLAAQGEMHQALELVKAEPLQRRTLGPGLQQCLFLRGALKYLLGQRAVAMADLDRLWALNPTFEGLDQAKSDMRLGSYRLTYDGHPIA